VANHPRLGYGMNEDFGFENTISALKLLEAVCKVAGPSLLCSFSLNGVHLKEAVDGL